MTDSPRHNEPMDGIWPGEEAWLRWEPQEPISPDLVDRWVDGIQADQDQIRLEAALAGEEVFPEGFLAAFEVPPPELDFVDRTMAALASGADPEFDSALSDYGVPEPSAGFVSRTLKALTEGSDPELEAALPTFVSPEPSADFVARTVVAITVDDETRIRPAPLRRLAESPSDRAPNWIPLVAALLVIGLGAFLIYEIDSRRNLKTDPSDTTAAPIVAAIPSPAPVSTAISLAMADADAPVETTPDALLLLAAGAFDD